MKILLGERVLKLSVPILLLIFNRLDTTKVVLNRLKQVKPKRLYLASDGPRESVQGEGEVVNEIRQYVLDNIDWECEIFTLFQKNNLGCKYAVHTAVQWFFSEEEKGIVLEDDIVPSVKYFEFACEMLDKYKDNKKIGSISGRNELGNIMDSENNSYSFTSKFFCWGWASWSDRIVDNRVDIVDSDGFKLQDISNLKLKEKLMLKGVIGLIKSNQVNSWAYPYDLSFRNKEQLCLIPSKNMVRNIGLDVAGAHSAGLGADTTSYYDDFSPTLDENVKVVVNSWYLERFLDKKFKSFLFLWCFSHSEYLGLARKIYKKIRKFVA